MRRKKTWLIAACAALVLVASVVGTIAYLTDTTDDVVNTFTVGKLLDNPLNFVLMEHKAEDDDKDGVYELKAEEVDKNTYTVLPGVDLPKDPFVKTKETLKLDAYVFVEVVGKTGTALHFTVDNEKWTELADVTGPKGGKVYVMKDNGGIAEAGEELGPISILTNNKITVENVEIEDAAAQFGGTVTFYGYMIQAGGFANANEAWTGYAGSEGGGSENPGSVQATLTMTAGNTESDWNKITITIKGTDIVSATYSFGENDLASTTLTAEQIEFVNSTDGLSIVVTDLSQETEYKTVLVVSNSAGQSRTIEATAAVGQAPPPM